MPPETLASALGAMARAVAESLDVKEVFARVADAARAVLPFDGMVVVRVEDGTLAVHSFVGDSEGPPQTMRREDFSPRLWEEITRDSRIDDLGDLLDPAFAIDRKIASDGIHALLSTPLTRGDRVVGFVSVGARRPGAFGEEHRAA